MFPAFFQISSSWLRFLSSFFESFFSGTLYIKPQPNPESTSTSGEVGPNSAGGFFLDKSQKKILCGDFLASPVDFFVTIEISLIILCSGTKISKFGNNYVCIQCSYHFMFPHHFMFLSFFVSIREVEKYSFAFRHIVILMHNGENGATWGK